MTVAKATGVDYPGEKKTQRGLFCSLQLLERWDISLLSQLTSDRTKENNLRLCQRRFNLDIRKKFPTKRAVKHWNRLPMGVVRSLSLEVFKMCRCGAWGNGFVMALAVLG